MTNRPKPPTEALTELLVACHRYCTDHGGNLPEMLSVALVDAAFQLGGSYALIEHRPGSWEAVHVQALAADADTQLGLDQYWSY